MNPKEHGVDAMMAAGREPAAFATTDWSMVSHAADAGTAEGGVALERLCRAYWRPLYRFARRSGLSTADAEDLTQGFFEDLLERGVIACADATRGRFRTFLLAAFRHFHSNQRACASSRKRGGGRTIVSLEAMREAEAQWQGEPATEESPERIYDRQWAISLFSEALAAVRLEYAAVGRGALFEALEVMLWGGRSGVAYVEIGHRLGMTEGAIKIAAHRLRQRFARQIRADVARTVLTPEDAEDEVRHLLATVSA
jgi:RNA polymerase sigma factor (sigma-70 family)